MVLLKAEKNSKMNVQMGKMWLENIKRSWKKKIVVNGVFNKPISGAAAEHAACLLSRPWLQPC